METATYFRKQAKDTCIALIPLLVMGIFYYGIRVLILALISVFSAILADFVCLLIQRKRTFIRDDLSSILTGFIFVMMLPATAPYWLASVGAIFAIWVIRYPFGGHYNTMFSPAITAFAFVSVCWTNLVTRYPAPLTKLPLVSNIQNIAVNTSPAYRLMNNGAEDIDLLNALLGNFCGPMGTTCLIVLFACLAYLIIKKAVIWQISAGTLGIVALFALIFPRVNANRFTSLILELCSGILVFSVIFIASMDNDELKTDKGKWFYGIVLGLFIVLFRNISNIELVCPFALLVMSTIDHKCDAYAEKLIYYVTEFSENAWIIIRWLGTIIKDGFLFLWNKLFILIQKIIDR